MNERRKVNLKGVTIFVFFPSTDTELASARTLLMFKKSRVGQVDRPIWSQSPSRYKSRGGGGGNASFSIVRPGEVNPYA